MREHFDKKIVTNPAKIADDFILALCISDNEKLPEAFNNALQLCSYIRELYANKESDDDLNSIKYKNDPVLKKYVGNLENDLIEAIKILDRAIKGSILNDVEKGSLEKLLTIATTPFWHRRTSDFRQRKFRRSSIRT